MEIDCVDKKELLIPTIYTDENLVEIKNLKLTLDNTKNLYSINYNTNQIEKFNSKFKKFFSFMPPTISNFEMNKNALVFWVRANSYFVLGQFERKNFDKNFQNLFSITDQTGGWVCFNLNGKNTKLLFEKLLTIDLASFVKKQLIRTSIYKINCFVLCHNHFENYTIICPTSFSESMKSRLLDLIKLME